MSCGCGGCLFMEYGGRATGVDSTELDHEDVPYVRIEPEVAQKMLCLPLELDSPNFTSDAQRALEARGYERINRHAPAPLPDAGANPDASRIVPTPARVIASQHMKCGLCGMLVPIPDNDTDGGWTLQQHATAAHPKRVAEAIATTAAPPAPEATGELDRERAEHAKLIGLGKEYREFHIGRERFNAVCDAFAALRARASEAEERLAAIEQRPNILGAALDVLTIEKLIRERDEAREQRDAIRKHSSAEIGRLGLEVARLRDDFAAAIARAEEMTHAHATERAARLKAEAERDAAKAPFVYCPECDSRKVAIDSDGCCATCGTEALVTDVVARLRNDHQRLAAAEAEVKRLNGVVDEHAGAAMRAGLELDRERAEHAKLIGLGKEYREFHIGRLEAENAVLRERNRRLEEAGDAMVEAECYDWPNLVARWRAAKADAPAAKETK